MGWVYLPQGDQAAHLCLKAIKARLEDFETLREYHNELLKLKKQQRQK
jgi:hypothetical protein